MSDENKLTPEIGIIFRPLTEVVFKRRAFLKRQKGTVLSKLFALDIKKKDQNPQDDGSESDLWKYTLEVLKFGKHMWIRRRGEPNQIPDKDEHPVWMTPRYKADQTPEWYISDGGWFMIRPVRGPFSEDSIYYYQEARIIIKSKPTITYEERFIKNPLDRYGFFDTKHLFGWEIQVEAQIRNYDWDKSRYVTDPNNPGVLPQSPSGPPNVATNSDGTVVVIGDTCWEIRTTSDLRRIATISHEGSVEVSVSETGLPSIKAKPNPEEWEKVVNGEYFEGIAKYSIDICKQPSAFGVYVTMYQSYGLDQNLDPVPPPEGAEPAYVAGSADVFTWAVRRYK